MVTYPYTPVRMAKIKISDKKKVLAMNGESRSLFIFQYIFAFMYIALCHRCQKSQLIPWNWG